MENNKVAINNYIKLREELEGFNKAYDKKIEELETKSKKLYEKLQIEFTDEDFIDYVLTTNSLSKLQDIKIGKLERLNLAKKQIS